MPKLFIAICVVALMGAGCEPSMSPIESKKEIARCYANRGYPAYTHDFFGNEIFLECAYRSK